MYIVAVAMAAETVTATFTDRLSKSCSSPEALFWCDLIDVSLIQVCAIGVGEMDKSGKRLKTAETGSATFTDDTLSKSSSSPEVGSCMIWCAIDVSLIQVWPPEIQAQKPEIQAQKPAPEDACIHTYIHTYTHAYIHTDRQTDRQTGRQTNRQTDRQTDKQTYMAMGTMYACTSSAILIKQTCVALIKVQSKCIQVFLA